MASNRVHRIAVIAGDGIGKEVVPEGVRVLEAAARSSASGFTFSTISTSPPATITRKHGTHDAGRLEGADRRARRDLLRRRRLARRRCPTTSRSGARCIQFRREFDQYVNLRPVRLMPGVPSPARRPQARRHRLLRRAREHRGRVFDHRRRACSPAPSARS